MHAPALQWRGGWAQLPRAEQPLRILCETLGLWTYRACAPTSPSALYVSCWHWCELALCAQAREDGAAGNEDRMGGSASNPS